MFSQFIRRRDADEEGNVECVTCGKKMDWKHEAHAGHFMSRRHLATRWDEKNVSPQCPGCNTFRAGEQYAYSLAIDNRYGEGTSEELLMLSRQTKKITDTELTELIEKYKTINKEQYGIQ